MSRYSWSTLTIHPDCTPEEQAAIKAAILSTLSIDHLSIVPDVGTQYTPMFSKKVVKRPPFGVGEREIILTCHVTLGGATQKHKSHFRVITALLKLQGYAVIDGHKRTEQLHKCEGLNKFGNI